jgi:MerR family mercuric resistance operon transcriptional regulator
MATEYTIGELAKAADVATSTLRYYERRGLVEPDNRSSGNYRLYDPETLERVRFIRAAQATGFTLDDVAMLLDVRVAANATSSNVKPVRS